MTDATRRNFLRYVGMVGGAGVMYETMAAMGLAPDTAAPAYAAPGQTTCRARVRAWSFWVAA
ncbi:twin-arginine translocation signal domain-containing protein [Arthrobacter sp. Z1-9]